MKSDIKMLMIDIETRPNLGYIWDLFNQNVGLPALVEAKDTICFAAEWYQRPVERQFYSIHTHGREAMTEAAFKLIDEADAVIHYNGRRFDIPHLNALFGEYRLGQPSAYTQIDLYSTVRKHFSIPSKKLQYVTKDFLKIAAKVETGGFDLWVKCMAGDDKAWAKMERYNRNDTKIMRKVYEEFLPWIDNHPNLNLYGGLGCPRCGEDALTEIKPVRTRVALYPQYRCLACKSLSRSGKRISGVDIR